MSGPPSAPAVAQRAECHVPRADGSSMRVQVLAFHRPDTTHPDVRLAGTRLLAADAERLRATLLLARLGEQHGDHRWRVEVSLQPVPDPGARDWELALVLADRMARGVWRSPAGDVVALGHSDDWSQGDVLRASGDVAVLEAWLAAHPGHPGEWLTGQGAGAEPVGWRAIASLHALMGHPDPRALHRSACTWFPVALSDGTARLLRLDVTVRPRRREAADDVEPITVFGADPATRRHTVQVLEQSRLRDPRRALAWDTLVRLPGVPFQGRSYELALVLADRLARGREPSARARVIASGMAAHWGSGPIENVDAIPAKCALLRAQAVPGDRVLLPAAARAELPEGFEQEMERRRVWLALLSSPPG